MLTVTAISLHLGGQAHNRPYINCIRVPYQIGLTGVFEGQTVE